MTRASYVTGPGKLTAPKGIGAPSSDASNEPANDVPITVPVPVPDPAQTNGPSFQTPTDIMKGNLSASCNPGISAANKAEKNDSGINVPVPEEIPSISLSPTTKAP
ncbi:hypothetical protein DSO57_1008795 [Entomophthora muscae]|uniref:Uncharacterized protein n=1 Tax=Entomophthora muscae TaxID=34485 RepID=A0ACC2UTA2_9FUNG|nr:hypothetical protein DSO57_1008795 [Entomophthora muscae]